MVIKKTKRKHRKPRSKPDVKWMICKACTGSGKSSSGWQCHPCKGNGMVPAKNRTLHNV